MNVSKMKAGIKKAVKKAYKRGDVGMATTMEEELEDIEAAIYHGLLLEDD